MEQVIENVLVTGGAGYIGSHTCIELLSNGYNVIVVDSLVNSSYESISRVEKITGRNILFIKEDIRNKEGIRAVFQKHKINAVIHFAGLKAVGESVKKPIDYYQNNVCGTLNLLDVMEGFQVRNIVFSSSACVYGEPSTVPISEDFTTSTSSPYGRSKLQIEEILKDIYNADSRWNISILRYFNPIGAHESGLIGEAPNDIPNNLMPYIAQVAVGSLKELSVFGSDYNTHDGTGVRDYIHVVDLARGHIKALEKVKLNPGLMIHNLGTGHGYSVLDIIQAFENVSGECVSYRFVGRRRGDVAVCYANPTKAEKELGWKAEYDLERMCKDTWRWQINNKTGYSR